MGEVVRVSLGHWWELSEFEFEFNCETLDREFVWLVGCGTDSLNLKRY